MKGYINIQRTIQSTPEWREKRTFSRFEAWFDMLFMAAFSERRVMLDDGGIITLGRGEILMSQREFAKRWGWSVSKVNRYFQWLKSPEIARIEVYYRRYVIMLRETPSETPSETPISIIKVCNYERYNGVGTCDETPSETADETPSETTINKYIELNNNKYTHTEYKDLIKFFAGACVARTREEQESMVCAAAALSRLISNDADAITQWQREDRLTRNMAQLWAMYPTLMCRFPETLTKLDLRDIISRYEWDDVNSIIRQMANKIPASGVRYQNFYLTFLDFARRDFRIQDKARLGNPKYTN